MLKIHPSELHNILIVFLTEKVGGLITIAGDCRCLHVTKNLSGFLLAGTEVKINKTEKTLRCLLLFGTFDAPAKCLFQEFFQYNAFYGCPYCLSPGETVKTNKGGHTHAYPFNENNLKTGYGEERTHEQTLQFAAESTKKTFASGVPSGVYGVKGFSWFMFIPRFDIIRGVAVDYMHGTLLGVVKMLLQLWMDKSYSSEPWSVRQKLHEIESRYMNLSPPACISRLPRSLIENFGHLKASELRTFLLFYSVPCLYGILPDLYFQHFILLVEAIYLLLQDSISISDLSKAASLLKHFCVKVKSLYDPRYETYNVHCLLHLADRVFDLGPLWTHSCFCYEDFNGELRSCFHGTQGVEHQIALAVSIQMKIPELVPLLPQGSSSKHLYDKMTRKNQEPFNKICIDDGGKMFSVGTVNNVLLSTIDQAILETLVGSISQVFKFHRVQLGGKLIHCKEYRCMSRRNNYTVEFHDPKTKKISYGQVEYYLKCVVDCPNPSYCVQGCTCQLPKYVAMVKEFQELSTMVISKDDITHCTVPHIIPVAVTDSNLKAIYLNDITKLCIFLHCGGDTFFVGIFPNTIEKD